MGHGTHWECIYPSVDDFVRRHLPEVLARGALISQVPWTDPACIPEGKTVDRLMVFGYPEGALRHFVICMGRPPENFVFSAYPAALGGSEHEMRVAEVIVGTHGVEGQVTATTSSRRTLNFFDPFFYLNKPRYIVGETCAVALAALAYRVEPLEQAVLEIDDPRWLAAFNEGEEAEAPVRIELTGTSYMMPLEGWDVDDYAFQIQAGPARTVDVGDTKLDRTLMEIKLGGDRPIEIPLYMAPHVRKQGFRPQVGEDMTGAFWLQGTLADTLKRL